MMKLLLLLFLVPATIYGKEASTCRKCGGRCTTSCPQGEIEFVQESGVRHCWADKNVCCIPQEELSCYGSGTSGACLTRKACETAGGVEIEGTEGYCTTVRRNPRICCYTGFSCPAPDMLVCQMGEIATGKAAYQSSTHGGAGSCSAFIADLVLDGNTDTDFFRSCSCSHTVSLNANQWLVVDLQDMYIIHHLTIYNRGDCCGSRLYDFSVAVGSDFSEATFNPIGYGDLCKFVPGARANGEIIEVTCNEPLHGRYVAIYMAHVGHLHLCEVQIMGSLESESGIEC